MGRTPGQTPFASDIEVAFTGSLDARSTTGLEADLTSLPFRYNGMLCSVTDDTSAKNGLYICDSNNGASLSDWTKVGSNLTSIDADTITITNLTNASIKANAAIDQSKISGLTTALATIPTQTSDLTNNSNFITSSQIPAIPTQTSDLTNNSNFVTSTSDTTVNNYASIGYVGHSGWAGFSHKNRANTTDYAILQHSGGHLLINTKSDQPIEFKHGNAGAQMRINPSGSVGINCTPNDNYKLDIAGDLNYTGDLRKSGSVVTIPSNTSDLSNDSGFITSSDIPTIPPALTTSSDIDINNIDCNAITTTGDISLALGKRVMLGQSVGDTNSHKAGIYWHTAEDYAITRTAGAWSGDYQQLLIRWGTGIILDINNADYGKSFVDVKGKLGVNVSSKPSTQFEVDGDSKFSGIVEIQTTGDGTGTDTSSQLRIQDDESTNPQYLKLGVNSTNNYSYIQSTESGVEHNTLLLNPLGGKVGVSNATPSYTLDITGDLNFTGTLYQNGTAFSGGVGATDDVVCNSVTAGIGNGRSKIGSLHSNNWAGWANMSRFGNNDYAIIQSNSGQTLLNASNNQYIAFRINNSDRMRMLSNGDFGIGTTAPQYKLDVNGHMRCNQLNCNQKITLVTSNTSSENDGGINDYQLKITNALLANDSNSLDLKIGVNKANLYGFIKVQQNNVVGGKELRLQDNGGDMTIGGNVELSLGKKFVLGGDVTQQNNAGLFWHSSNHSSYQISRSNNAWSGSHAQLQILWGTGIVVNPGVYSGANNKRKVDIVGRVEADSGSISSDNRLKHNEEDLTDCLQTISKLNPQKYLKTPFLHDDDGNYYGANHNFDLNDVPDGVSYEAGFIAQQVTETVPELGYLVSGEEQSLDDSGNEIPTRLSFNYNSLHAYHVGAIKELHQLVLSLQERIKALENA